MKRALIHNKKTYESINLAGKGKYIVKIRIMLNGSGVVTYKSSIKVERQK